MQKVKKNYFSRQRRKNIPFFRITRKNMCLSIDISQSKEKEFNIDTTSQRS